MLDVKQDPSFEPFLGWTEPLDVIRGTLCILFGYWNDKEFDRILTETRDKSCKLRLAAKEPAWTRIDMITDIRYPANLNGLKQALADKYGEESYFYKTAFKTIEGNKAYFEKKVTPSIHLLGPDAKGHEIDCMLVKWCVDDIFYLFDIGIREWTHWIYLSFQWRPSLKLRQAISDQVIRSSGPSARAIPSIKALATSRVFALDTDPSCNDLDYILGPLDYGVFSNQLSRILMSLLFPGLNLDDLFGRQSADNENKTVNWEEPTLYNYLLNHKKVTNKRKYAEHEDEDESESLGVPFYFQPLNPHAFDVFYECREGVLQFISIKSTIFISCLCSKILDMRGFLLIKSFYTPDMDILSTKVFKSLGDGVGDQKTSQRKSKELFSRSNFLEAVDESILESEFLVVPLEEYVTTKDAKDRMFEVKQDPSFEPFLGWTEPWD
ncbi:cytochrome c, partial [Striga asiatica]